MNKTKIILTLLVSIIMGTTLPLDQQPVKKSRWNHLKECLKGNEPCTKTDFAIFGVALLLARSSFHATLSIGKYYYEPSAHSVEADADKVTRTNLIGTSSETVSKFLKKWGPGRLPKRMVRKTRKWWATPTHSSTGKQKR